jgi:hypothetical protein
MTCDLVIDLEHDTTTEPVQTRITFNDLELYTGPLSGNQSRMYFSTPSYTDHNSLKVYLLNKSDEDGTQVDTAGLILRDTFINVKSILVDKRKLKYMLFDKGLILTNDGASVKYSTYLSSNGYYEICFALPIKKVLQEYYSTFSYTNNRDVQKDIEDIDKLLLDFEEEQC